MTSLDTRTPDTGGGPGARRVNYPLAWLRGIAALSVLTFHAYQHNRTGAEGTWPWSGSAHHVMLGTELFVELFFVLSGFVLWLPIARSTLAGQKGRSGRSLLMRRMARLVPLYFTVIIVVWAITNPSLPGHWQDLLLHLSFTHVYSDQYIFWNSGPAWSLAVEFHFYVLMSLSVPVLHAVIGRTTSFGARLVTALALPAVLVVGGIAYLVWATMIADISPTNWSIWFSPLSRAADFGVGMGLAVLCAAGVRLRRSSRAWLGVIGLATLVVLVFNRPESTMGAWWTLGYAAAITVSLAGIVLHDGPWPAMFSWRPLVFVGGLGYGIYLIHEPVMRVLTHWGILPEPRTGAVFLATAVLVAIPTIALAWVSSKTVEAAGLKLLGSLDPSGKPRDYYAHVTERE